MVEQYAFPEIIPGPLESEAGQLLLALAKKSKHEAIQVSALAIVKKYEAQFNRSIIQFPDLKNEEECEAFRVHLIQLEGINKIDRQTASNAHARLNERLADIRVRKAAELAREELDFKRAQIGPNENGRPIVNILNSPGPPPGTNVIMPDHIEYRHGLNGHMGQGPVIEHQGPQAHPPEPDKP
jgi:hypothetical protein